MQIKNNYDKNVFNGDIGFIESIDQEDRTLVISFDDRKVEYDFTELDEIILLMHLRSIKPGQRIPHCSCSTVHQHYVMLQRNLIHMHYQGKKVFVLVEPNRLLPWRKEQ